jgi:hypothetical protein
VGIAYSFWAKQYTTVNETLYTSTINGLITKAHVAPGQMVLAGAPLVTIVPDTMALEGHAFVEKKDISTENAGHPLSPVGLGSRLWTHSVMSGAFTIVFIKPNGACWSTWIY